MRKRTLALLFLLAVVALVAATLLVLRTRWAGDRICELAARRATLATGLPAAFGACRVDPFALEVEVSALRLGPAEAPVFTAERVLARLAAIQTLGGRVRLARLQLVRPRLVLAVPGGRGGGGPAACPPPLLSRVEVRQLDLADGTLDLSLPGGVRVTAGRVDLRTRPAPRSLRTLAAAPRTRLEAVAERVRLEGAGDRPSSAPHAALAADVALDLSVADVSGAQAEVDGVDLAVSGRVRNLCAPVLDLAGAGSGPFREVLALTRIHPDAPAKGIVRAEARITGPLARPDVAGTLRFERAQVGWFDGGDAVARVRLRDGGLDVERAEWALPGATVTGRGRVGLDATVPIEAELDTGGADLADLLERVGITGSWVTVRLDAKGRIAGAILPRLSLAGTVAGDFRDLRVYTRSWKTVPPGLAPVLAVHRGRLDSPVRITDEEISYPGAKVSAGRGTAELDAVARLSAEAGYGVRWRGQLDLDALGKVAGVPVGGLAWTEGSAAAAPYGNPRASGHARADGFRYLGIDLGNAACDFDYGPDFVLRVHGAEGVRGSARWRGEGAVDLEPSPAFVRRGSFEAKGQVRELFDAVRDWLPRARPFREVFDGEVAVAATASGPADALDGTFDARMAAGTFYGRPFDSARMSGTYARGDEARYERAEIRRGSGTVRMTGRYGFSPPFPWDLDVSYEGLALGDLGLPLGIPGAGWAGTASGTATLRGSVDHPDVRFAANGDGVGVHGVALGTVQAAGTLKEKRVLVTGGAEGLRFEGEATLEGRTPFRARADLALEDVARLVPGGVPAGIRARVKGEASAEGELEALDAARARVRLDELQVGHSELKVEATAPVVLTATRGRLEIPPVTLVGPNTELTVSGARAATGQLDLAAAGKIDLRLLAGLVPELRRPHGQLSIEAHVSGTVPDPVLVGAGRLDDAGFQLKGTNMLFSELRGALAFSQNRVLFEQLSAGVNGGRASLGGEIELASFAPVRHRIEATLDEVPLALTPALPATLSGRVEAAGTPDATTLTGRLHVVRARYTANVGLDKIEMRRRAPAPPRPYDKAGEWLRFDLQVVVDGDARVENDLVRGAVKGELTLTGSLAAPGLVGALAMGDGSRAAFRGNEFVLSHAVLDFTDRNKIDAALDVHGESQVRDYQIFMHAFGPLADPQVTLTSTPPLSQPDIITLLSLGFTRRDAAAGAGVQGVATAAAAQALFSASGLDEQVKRFLPRSQVVRDLSVRITSEWSEVSGQVEPRAEFESWLLRDRLRLRYQAPLSGARGQKAQAELRLGEHTAVQYQWDNDNPDVATGDHGVDMKLRWEWADE